MPHDDPTGAQRALTCGKYSLHPLSALDGVLLYVTLDGETVGYFFGATEEEAAEAVAAAILQDVAR
jgi:hypothetical protein